MENFKLSGIQLGDNLASPKSFDQISFFVDLVKDSGSVGTTYSLLEELNTLINQHSAELGENKKKYEDLITQLSFVCFQLLEDDELEKILKTRMFEAYRNSADLKRSVTFMFAPNFIRDDYTKLSRILRYLEENTEVVGTSNIILSDGKTVAPMISNWLKDYKSEIAEDKGTLNIVTYVTKNKNCKVLSQDEIDFLRYVLSFYDWLRFRADKVSLLTSENTITEQQDFVPPKSVTNIPGPASPSVPLSTLTPKSQSVPPPISVFNTPAPWASASESESGSDLKPTKELTVFEKKLAQVSAPPLVIQHGADLEVLKHRMEEAKAPSVVKLSPDSNKINAEIKREVSTRELPAHQSPKPVQESIKTSIPKPVIKPAPVVSVAPLAPVRPVIPKPILTSKPQPLRKPASSFEASLPEIKNINDLKKVELDHLRRGPLDEQIAIMRAKIIDLAKQARVMPYYALAAFEESPLYRAYINHGHAVFGGDESASDLTKEEFEVIADLRRDIQRM